MWGRSGAFFGFQFGRLRGIIAGVVVVMKRELDRAIRAAGGVAALARLLAVSRSTVSRWLASGVPSKKRSNARQLLLDYRARRGEARRQRRVERDAFQTLMRQAKEAMLLPRGKSSEGVRAGPRTSGYQHTRAFERYLTHDVINELEAWALDLKRRFELWQMVAKVSIYGRGEHRGYGTVYYQLPHPEAGDFAIESLIATPKNRSRRLVVGSMIDMLEGQLADLSQQTFIHEATVYNYRMRTEAERKTWETSNRRKREKKSKKWKKNG